MNHPATRQWIADTLKRYANGIFGELRPALIWTDSRDGSGELIVPVDPEALVNRINAEPHILLHDHDPGAPIGQVLESAHFRTDTGRQFVTAVFGYYAGGEVLTFAAAGLGNKGPVRSPSRLPELPGAAWIQFATDPREVSEAWVDAVCVGAPLRVERTELSHNADDSTRELIRIGIMYLPVLWNPFVTAIGTEAGKAAYAAIHDWLRKLFLGLADRRNPILDVHTHVNDCQVSFLLRGKDISRHIAAHDSLPGAAAQAEHLVANLKARRMVARQLVYEFERDALVWYPSYVILDDHRIITDHISLLAIEKLPKELSLGLTRGDFETPAMKPAVTDDDLN
ncbi:hypothetical protein [Paraburkholderia sp. JHI869]|uniref:hypothetical protein n=1 Tax=Paraburkholderia sp. JHI869 TaxID=3112959 RepID=UPI003173F0BF